MGVIKRFGVTVLASVLGAACTKTVNECSVDGDCKDIAYPFCDVNGEYPPSSGAKNVCTILPPDCPVVRCGCAPGATTCAGGTLSVCNPGGKDTTATVCSLGCAATNDRCLTFTPLNGLDAALLASASEPSITLPNPVTIDTDTGTVKNQGGITVQMKSIVIPQSGAPEITAFIARSIDITDATVRGSRALALVASEKVDLHGVIDISANHTLAGPGGMESEASVGLVTISGGGGGNATDGAAGAASPAVGGDSPGGAGGKAMNLFEPLAGGGRGGATGSGPGGGGGGALQIVAGTAIVAEPASRLDAGGGGATTDGNGGGAGGTVILESPRVELDGAIVANGAAGSACGVPAADATTTEMPAAGASCSLVGGIKRAGSGGTRLTMPTSGFALTGAGTAGGGGAVGRLLVRTVDGVYSTGGSSLISAGVVTQKLPVH